MCALCNNVCLPLTAGFVVTKEKQQYKWGGFKGLYLCLWKFRYTVVVLWKKANLQKCQPQRRDAYVLGFDGGVRSAYTSDSLNTHTWYKQCCYLFLIVNYNLFNTNILLYSFNNFVSIIATEFRQLCIKMYTIKTLNIARMH